MIDNIGQESLVSSENEICYETYGKSICSIITNYGISFNYTAYNKCILWLIHVRVVYKQMLHYWFNYTVMCFEYLTSSA